MIKVMVVDDHQLIRMGLSSTLSAMPGLEVVCEACSGEEALTQVRIHQPDLVLMDIRMPGIGGIEATRRIITTHPAVKVIIVTALSDDVYPNKLLKAGACAYITKNAEDTELSLAIRKVMENEIYVSPSIAQQMVVHGLRPGQESSPLASLSQREIQIAQMITNGHRAGEVAAILNISPKTINTHKYRIYEKLGVTNDVELTLCAVKYGLVDPNDVL